MEKFGSGNGSRRKFGTKDNFVQICGSLHYQCKVSGENEHVFEMASVESFRMKKVESVEKEASAGGRKSIYLYFLNY